jgi:hypothetical protein
MQQLQNKEGDQVDACQSLAYLGCAIQGTEQGAAMCFFCMEDDTPFHLRKSSAFPRKMVAEAVEPDSGLALSERGLATAFSCDSPEPAPPPSAWPKRKAASSLS